MATPMGLLTANVAIALICLETVDPSSTILTPEIFRIVGPTEVDKNAR